MKLTGARALAFCDKPQGKTRIALIFGGDPGLVSTAADTLAQRWVPDIDPFNLVKLSDDELKRDPQQLADELVARSLMGGDRLVRVRIDRETSAKPVIEILGDIEKGLLNPEAAWIVEGGDLGKTSKLRGAFEASDVAQALQLFADDETTINDLVTRRLAAAGVVMEEPALAAFVAELPGDRRLALSELEKLELYAIGLGRAVTAHDMAQATLSINRYLDAGGNPISALRTLHFRMLRVIDAVGSGAGSGMRLRPPVFEKEWPAFSRAVRDWRGPALQRTIARLYEAEKSCKQAGAPSDAIIRNLIHRIATRTI
jgi:DNA polymerase-3 subunit delta